jgi:hypothetical protein
MRNWDSRPYLANRRVDLGRGSDFVLAVKLGNALVVGPYLPNTAKEVDRCRSQSHKTIAISAKAEHPVRTLMSLVAATSNLPINTNYSACPASLCPKSAKVGRPVVSVRRHTAAKRGKS